MLCRRLRRGVLQQGGEPSRIAQPSVSQQVRKLEDELQTILFDRGSRGVIVSAAGASLLASARRVLAAMGEFTAAALARTGQLSGSLDLGVVDGLEETTFPSALGVLRSRHPLLELRLQDGTSRTLLERLMSGTSMPLSSRNLREPSRSTWPLACSSEEEVVVVRMGGISNGEPGERVDLKGIGPELTVSYPPESGVRVLIDDAARRVGATLRFSYTTNDPSLHVALARAGVGAALAVGSVRTLAAAVTVDIRRINPPIVLRKLLVWTRAPRPSRAVEELIAAFDAGG